MNDGWSPWQRGVARSLVFFFLSTTSLPAHGQQWQDPNQTTFGEDVTLENSADGLRTEFTIDSTRTTIGWNDLQQPENNTLVFQFTNPSDQSAVANFISAPHPSALNGNVECLGGTCAFVNPYGIYVGNEAILDVGNLALIAGTIDQQDFLSNGELNAMLSGSTRIDGTINALGNVLLLGREVTNNGEIHVANGALLMLAGQEVSGVEWEAIQNDSLARAEFSAELGGGRVQNSGRIEAPDAALLAQRIQNQGEILIDDGALLMVAADGIWVRRFDDPVSIRLPQPGTAAPEDGGATTGVVEAGYAIENSGRIDAGLGHVRLSAADPLGYSIRQGKTGSISAHRVDVAGNEGGRVHLSGQIDAVEDPETGLGGQIDVTGRIIALAGADLDASGTGGGGQIQIGGEQEGRGELQRAEAVLIDRESSVRADALEQGDGGRVIVFSETLTSIDGALSARGGAGGGDGGFIETSGHRRLSISTTPDASAPNGAAGDWLIDPVNIEIVADNAGGACENGIEAQCLNQTVEEILDPDFDSALFDGTLRPIVDPSDRAAPSQIEASTIAKALGVGTNVTLSTLAFGSDQGDQDGDIHVLAPITVDDTNALPGTTATLTLLAARDIIVDNEIRSGSGIVGETANLALNVVLRANDPLQISIAEPFSYDRVQGDVRINADVYTGGGRFDAQGAAVALAAPNRIVTAGGDADLRAGSLDEFALPGFLNRGGGTPGINAAAGDPVGTGADAPFVSQVTPLAITIEGDIDTSRIGERGGDIRMTASSTNISTGGRRDVVPGQLTIAPGATLVTGGGDITLSGGQQAANGNVFAGNVRVEGTLETCSQAGCTSSDADGDGYGDAPVGGDIQVLAFRANPADNLNLFDSDAVPADGTGGSEGGEIILDVAAANGVRTGGGNLSIGVNQTRSISLDGGFITNQLPAPPGVAADAAANNEEGLVRITALDTFGIDTINQEFGDGIIQIGANAPTRIETGGLQIEGRQVRTSDATTPQSVSLIAQGGSKNPLGEVAAGTIRIEGGRSVDFGANTSLDARRIEVVAAANPEQLSQAERQEADSDLRLRFRGTQAAPAVGVTLDGREIEIRTGDGTTGTTSLFVSAAELEDAGVPTDLGLQRNSTANYAGLRIQAAPNLETLTIAQDADWTITGTTATGDAELDLDAALVGAAAGVEFTFESSDGTLTIDDATGMNGANEVLLLGGLFLPPTPTTGAPAADTVTTPNTVVFGDGLTPLGVANRFDVDKLTVSTPGDFTLAAQIADSITRANELTFEAGRDTGVDNADGRGDLIVDGSGSPILLGDPANPISALELLAGASGFGDLVFDATPTTTLQADAIDLRAGAGSDSANLDPSKFSRITGLATGVVLRDSSGADFGATGSSAQRFSYRQDASIDAESDLPALTQFGATTAANGFSDSGAVVYSVRSDKGGLDLDDATLGNNEAERFRNAALELISSTPLDLSDEFRFIGDSITLGGIGNFQFTEALATAFNDTGSNPDSKMTLRSGLGGTGSLSFSANVPVVASRIDLIAGDGAGGGTGSTVTVGSAQFDLRGAAGDRIFVLHQDNANFLATSLPTDANFLAGASRPDVFVLRSDSGLLNLDNLDFANLPIRTGGSERLVLEADTIRLTRSDSVAPDLDLVGSGRRLRIRANDLFLTANAGTDDADGGRVRAGATTLLSGGADVAFDAEALLVEAFDPESESATTSNLSDLSKTAAGVVDLAAGRGLRSLTIEQAGRIELGDLADRSVVSGRFLRSFEDDANNDDAAIPTLYSLSSEFGSIAIDPNKVNGSNLLLDAVSATGAGDGGQAFDIAAGLYTLDGFSARTIDSISIQSGTSITATNRIELSAAQLTAQPEMADLPLPSLTFLGTGTTLSANQITLQAGQAAVLSLPDGPDADGEPDEIDDANLPRIDLGGLTQISQTGDPDGSFFELIQNASIVFSDFNLVDALTSGSGRFDVADFESAQGNIEAERLRDLNSAARSVEFRTSDDAQLSVDFGTDGNPFDVYDAVGERVVLRSNDTLLFTTVSGIQLDLATPKLEFRSTQTEADLARAGDTRVGELRDTEDFERAIVRIHQASDFAGAGSTLPSAAQFTLEQFVRNDDGTISLGAPQRSDLSRIDLEFETTDPATLLILDNAIRDAAFGSNLILRSAGDLAIDLDGPAPGYGGVEVAALQLNSLDLQTPGGTGTIRFDTTNFPTTEQTALGANRLPPVIESAGDQRFAGNLDLDQDLSIRGRDIHFAGDIDAAAGAGLRIETAGRTTFEGNVGAASPLDFLRVFFESNAPKTPTVEFGARDTDGNAIASDQTVVVRGDVLFAGKAEDPNDANAFAPRAPGSPIATIGKASGDLSIETTEGDLTLGVGERIAVGGQLTLTAIAAPSAGNPDGGSVTLSDAAALDLVVQGREIILQRRANGIVLDANGETQADSGPSIVANRIEFIDENSNERTPRVVGAGADPIFGIPNPFNTAGFPSFLDDFSVFQISPNGRPLEVGSFDRGGIIPAFIPRGASRSDLSGAYGPDETPIPIRRLADPGRVRNPNRLAALGVDVRTTPSRVQAARLRGAAVIDDLGVEVDADSPSVYVSEARLDAKDTEEAIQLYAKIFGSDDDRAEEVRAVLQDALDRYLEDSRARRVVGFELRRFVKNRPSTLLTAYQMLDDLDDLFRFHRRLGLSPGEYRRIQRTWLERIQPEGITLDELSEAIHPSRYVRGSDILDIFGR